MPSTDRETKKHLGTGRLRETLLGKLPNYESKGFILTPLKRSEPVKSIEGAKKKLKMPIVEPEEQEELEEDICELCGNAIATRSYVPLEGLIELKVCEGCYRKQRKLDKIKLKRRKEENPEIKYFPMG